MRGDGRGADALRAVRLEPDFTENPLASMLCRVGRTIVLCTHDLSEAEALASRVGVLHTGRLLAEGPTQELLGSENVLAFFRPDAADDGAAR